MAGKGQAAVKEPKNIVHQNAIFFSNGFRENGIVKEPKNIVHQNAILSETVAKENRFQKLYTNYSINPFKEFYVIAGKPNQAEEEGERDDHFLQVIKRANLEPVKKYKQPQTEAQEIGWITKPLIDTDRGDTRLNFFRHNSPITKFMDKAWLEKEQQNMGN